MFAPDTSSFPRPEEFGGIGMRDKVVPPPAGLVGSPSRGEIDTGGDDNGCPVDLGKAGGEPDGGGIVLPAL